MNALSFHCRLFRIAGRRLVGGIRLLGLGVLLLAAGATAGWAHEPEPLIRDTLRILALGDSLTAGGYPETLARQLRREGYAASILNAGVPGATAGDVARLLSAQAEAFKRFNPDVIFLLAGTNNARSDLPYLGPEAYRDQMEDIFRRLYEELFVGHRRPAVILSTLLPIIPQPAMFTAETRRRIDEELNPVVLQLAAEKCIPLVDNHAVFSTALHLLPDGIHPGEEGTRRLARSWMEALRSAHFLPEPSTPVTGLVYGDIFLRHDTGPGHPERPARLRAILERFESDWPPGLILLDPVKADRETVLRAHTNDLVRRIEAACRDGARWVDSRDTPISPESFDVALHATGGVVSAVDAVMAGTIRNAFCAVRPPGHHATPSRAMGFCLFNHVAIAALHLLEVHGLERVAIVDWDVHHGNGIQDIAISDPRIWYASIHQHPFYPGTGHAAETGEGAGAGTLVNLPLAAGAGDADYLAFFRETLLPALHSFKPEFILISAGFDAHQADPLGGMQVTSEGFAHLTRMMKSAAETLCDGRLVSVLEGGYDLRALAESVRAHVEVLLEPEIRER